MPITFALVAVGRNILAQHEAPGNPSGVPSTAVQLLEKLGRHDTRASYAFQASQFHVLVQNELVYICVADQNTQKRLTFAFLEDLKEAFCKKYAPPGKKYPDVHSLTNCKEFAPEVGKLVTHYNTNPDVDKIAKVRREIADVQNIMVENIERVIQRGEKISTIVDRTDALSESANTFKRNARTLKNEMRWKRIKIIIMVVVVCLALGLILFFVVCKGVKCVSGN